jgi:putative ABC transport system ATP-binding protein
MIRLTDISRRYRSGATEIAALDGVSLSLEAGEFVAISGPSGCGKTTLLNVLGLLDVPCSGSFQLFGRELVGEAEGELTQLRRGNIGFIFQGFNLLRELTVLENVELPLLGTRLTTRQRRRQVREMIELVGLESCATARPSQLSGGQQQRTAIARAIVLEPKLLLADEPTGNLDAEAEADVFDVLGTLRSLGTTLVMATHSSGCTAFVTRNLIMSAGRIISSSPAM